MVIGTHGSTYGGNPLAMAAGQAVFDIVANDEFLADVRPMGERLRSALEQMIPNHDHLFESVRGVGPDARHQDEDRQPRLRQLSAHARAC